MYLNTYFANIFDLVSLPTDPLKKNPCSKQMADSKCWVMNGETVAKATMSVPPGTMSHEDSIGESSNFNLCKNLRSEA